MRKVILGVVGACVVAACLLAATGAFLWMKSPHRTILRNFSGDEITNVCLSVQNLDGTKSISRNAERIGEGESLVLRHGLNDSRVKVSFCRAGNEHTYAEDYVDLWTGEGWLLDVTPDGSIQSGYLSTREQ